MQSELVWASACRLGESPVWHVDDASIYFVDNKGQEVLACAPDGSRPRRWPMPQRIGWLAPRAGARRDGRAGEGGVTDSAGGASRADPPDGADISGAGIWVAGFQQGVAALTLEPEVRHELLHRLHDADSPMHLNDGKVDAAGRLWFGTVNGRDRERLDGQLYRLAADDVAPRSVDAGYRVTNGPAFSPDGRTLYHADSAAKTIFAFDVTAEGQLSNKRIWVEFNRYEGYPDGMTTDAEGHLWVAHFAGYRVTQRDARTARVLRTVVVPTPNATSVAFGGPGLNDLFITTARGGLADGALAVSPLSGGLFVARGVGPGRLSGVFGG